MAVQRRELIEVAGGVWVAMSQRDSTTSTVIVGGSGLLLVDPAWLPYELSGLAAELTKRKWRVTAGFSTHAHHDHLLWHPDFGDVPRWASATTCALAIEHRVELLESLGSDWPWPEVFGRVDPLDGPSLPFGAEKIEVVIHDGHAPGHSALWLPERGVLIVGDMLSDVELPFWPDDLPAYLAALDQLTPYVRKARVLIPGHGTPTSNPGTRLDADQRYLDAVITGSPSDDPRLGLPGMAANHAHLVSMARG